MCRDRHRIAELPCRAHRHGGDPHRQRVRGDDVVAEGHRVEAEVDEVEVVEVLESGEYDYFFITPTYEASLLQWKKDASVADALPRLKNLYTLLTGADFSTPESIKAAVWSYAEEVGRGEVLWPLRVALSGQVHSPDPFTIASIIGGEETLRRIAVACDKITG